MSLHRQYVVERRNIQRPDKGMEGNRNREKYTYRRSFSRSVRGADHPTHGKGSAEMPCLTPRTRTIKLTRAFPSHMLWAKTMSEKMRSRRNEESECGSWSMYGSAVAGAGKLGGVRE